MRRIETLYDELMTLKEEHEPPDKQYAHVPTLYHVELCLALIPLEINQKISYELQGDALRAFGSEYFEWKLPADPEHIYVNAIGTLMYLEENPRPTNENANEWYDRVIKTGIVYMHSENVERFTAIWKKINPSDLPVNHFLEYAIQQRKTVFVKFIIDNCPEDSKWKLMGFENLAIGSYDRDVFQLYYDFVKTMPDNRIDEIIDEERKSGKLFLPPSPGRPFFQTKVCVFRKFRGFILETIEFNQDSMDVAYSSGSDLYGHVTIPYPSQ